METITKYLENRIATLEAQCQTETTSAMYDQLRAAQRECEDVLELIERQKPYEVREFKDGYQAVYNSRTAKHVAFGSKDYLDAKVEELNKAYQQGKL